MVQIGRVVSVHGLRFASPPWAGWLNTRMLSADADRIICVSDVVRHAFLGGHVPPRKLSLVPSSVDLGCFRPGVSGLAFRRELGVEPKHHSSERSALSMKEKAIRISSMRARSSMSDALRRAL